MQTFLPEYTLVGSAEALDNKRLNKQILEGYQILKLLSDYSDKKAWAHHPAVLMWKGHEYSLRSYTQTMIAEARTRGIKTDKNQQNLWDLEKSYGKNWGTGMPSWFSGKNWDRIRITHQANLYRKDPVYYAKYSSSVNNKLNKPCCDRCQYFWVTHEEKNV